MMARLGLILFCAIAQLTAASESPSEDLAALFDAPYENVRDRYENTTDPVDRVISGIVYGYRSFDFGIDTASQIAIELGEAGSFRGDVPEEVYLALHNYHGWIMARTGDLEGARINCSAALENIDRIIEPALRYSVYSCNSFVDIRSGDVASALKKATQATIEAKSGGSTTQYVGALGNEALLLYYSRLYDNAMQNYERLTAMQDKIEPGMMRIVRFNLGLVYLEIGEAQKALEEFVTATRWTEESGQTERALIAHTHKANALNALNRHAEAVETLEPWLKNPDQYTKDTFIHALMASATAHLALGNASRALSESSDGYAIAKREGNELRRGPLALLRSRALLANNMTEEAFLQLQATIQEHRQRSDQYLAEALSLLSELALTRGDKDLAIASLKESAEIFAQNKTAELSRRISILDSIHELESTREQLKIVAAMADRDAAQSEQRITLLFAAFTGTLIILAIAWLLLDRRRQREEIKSREQQSEKLEQLVSERTVALERRVTEAMQQKNQLENLQTQLTEAEKMRALGTLTGGVAHDFNNLLSVIVGSAGLIELSSDLDEDTWNHIQAILSAADSGTRITEALLAYARQQPLNPVPSDIGDVLRDAIPMLQRSLDGGRKLEAQLESGVAKVDTGALNSAVLNLVINAADASDAGSIIRISGGPRFEENTYTIEVIDEGQGMDEDAVEKAFEPFFSTKSSTRSTGLGLSMVHGFAHQSGGDIAIKSQKGVGTTIRLSLPLCHSDELRIYQETSQSGPLSVKVLCVDDNPDVLKVLCLMLEKLGHDVTGFGTTAAARDCLSAEEFELLITDVVLPGDVSGIEFADQVAGQYPDMKILLVSGFTEMTSTEYLLLPRPFNSQSLNAQLQQLYAVTD